MSYHLVCGLEIHTELKTESKMFCGCRNDPFGASKPNIYTCPVCLGMPGALPVPNKKAIEWTIKLGLYLHCRINLQSHFDRKNYFYPDLAKSYQISQDALPFCYDGYVDTSEGRVRINRIHLEEDTAKLLHETVKGKKVTLIDFNRSSVPLIEIVTEPDIHSSSQAKEYAQKIQEAVRHLGIGEAEMQKGQMRLEANISLQSDKQKKASKLPDYKVEVKNINSFNFMGQAIDYEIERQTKLLTAKKTVVQETRGWDSVKQETFSQRQKENAAGYRYFPDPDLPEIVLTQEFVDNIKATLPETPEQVLVLWQEEYGIESRYGQLFLERATTIAWAQELWQQGVRQKLDLNQLANFLVNKKIDFDYDETPEMIIEKYQQLVSVDDIDEQTLCKLIDKVLAQYDDEIKRYQAGETKLFGFFMGQVMRDSAQKLDAGQVNKLLREKLTE